MARPLNPPAQPDRAFAHDLLAWFRVNKRDMPWRRDRHPYGVWLSETMLQQTTVATVTPRWRRFLERFPTIADLAAAPMDDVLHEWTGLGYYARARNLHRAAGVMAREHNGQLPRTFTALRELPGFGDYTAAAVASIAFGERVPVMDTNVERVLSRVIALAEPSRSREGKTRLRQTAESLIPHDDPAAFNEAIMELGALVCTPRAPRCGDCPVRRHCHAYSLGIPERFPILPEKKPLEPVTEVAVLVEREGRILILQRPPDVSFGGMWELPRVRCKPGEEPAHAAARALHELAGLSARPAGPIFRKRHTVMRHRIELQVFEATTTSDTISHPDHAAYRWTTAGEWLVLPKSVTMQAIAQWLDAR